MDTLEEFINGYIGNQEDFDWSVVSDSLLLRIARLEAGLEPSMSAIRELIKRQDVSNLLVAIVQGRLEGSDDVYRAYCFGELVSEYPAASKQFLRKLIEERSRIFLERLWVCNCLPIDEYYSPAETDILEGLVLVTKSIDPKEWLWQDVVSEAVSQAEQLIALRRFGKSK